MKRGGRSRLLAEFDRAAGPGSLAGVDEAGRGPLAGPVVAAAVMLPPEPLIEGIDDSKKLTPKNRQALALEILERAQAVGVGLVDADQIDRLNILRATERAWCFALCGLCLEPALVLIDGPRAPGRVPDNCRKSCLRPVVGGDAKSYSIAAASIIAKCIRDAIMREYDIRHPGYGFARHKGYGTMAHLEALARLGPCQIHRRSFAPVAEAEGLAGRMA
jgi:ribonuclease HII